MKESSVISLKEFQAYTQGIEQTCRDWFSGALSDDSFLSLVDGGYPRKLTIQEITSPDDDFDWSTIPDDVMKACDDAHSRYGNAWRLTLAVKGSIQELNSIAVSQSDPLIRVAILGANLGKAGFSHELLSQSQSQHPANESFEPPAPRI